MPKPKQILKKSLKASLKAKLKDAKRIAILGVGSELKGDDAAGFVIATKLCSFFEKSKNIKVFLGGDAPENLSGEIKKFKPQALIIIDAADFQMKAGHIELLDPKDLGGVSFSTHRLPLNIFADYLCKCFPCEVIIVAIQPLSLSFGVRLSKEVASCSKEVCRVIKEVLK